MDDNVREEIKGNIDWEGLEYWVQQGFWRNWDYAFTDEQKEYLEKAEKFLTDMNQWFVENDLMP